MTRFGIDDLPERGKEPNSAANLSKWISKVEIDMEIGGGRLSWIVASSILVAALQRTPHADGQPLFLLKGGSLIELRLGLEARSTGDIDTLFRGDFGEMLEALDHTLAEDWGPIEFTRSEVETVDAPRRIKPRRFTVSLSIRGKTWRSIDVEVSATEGDAAERIGWVDTPRLGHFGLASAEQVASLVMEYQVAQKLHACTDPHNPPESENYRPRDVVDLLLIREALFPTGIDLTGLRDACVDVFAVRAEELAEQALPGRNWPPKVVAHEHWHYDYSRATDNCGFALTLAEAVDEVNDWIDAIDNSRP